MPRTSRRRQRQAEQDEAFGLLALVIGSVLYTKLSAFVWQWKIALAVVVTSLVSVTIAWGIRSARRRYRQQLMLTDALSLSPAEFEVRIKHLLQDLGWERVEHCGGSGDGGVDVHGRYNGQICIVQCKQYRGRVGPNYLRELFGTLQDSGATRAFLITTGYFTKQGYDFARGKPIELWDGQTLAKRFQEQQQRLQDPSIHRRERRRTRWILSSLAGINALVLGWAALTATPVAPVTMTQTQLSGAALARETATSQGAYLVTPIAPTTTNICGEAAINGVERLVLRSAPGLQSERLRDYPARTIVTILCTTPVETDGLMWQNVRIENEQGWMSKRFLK